jgi:TonB-dependent receptor
VSQARNQVTEIKLQLVALAVAGACATMSGTAFAQAQDAAPGSPATTDISQPQAAATTVTVTGIRASMQSTLNLKRNSDGIVDGIVADDIGKFPDTNLAEAVQRISGVSIDRSNGEGQRVTIRGVGPDLNMVLLNGRNMPTSNLDNRGSRAFDFSNLASEAVSQIQVYKSSRADTPSGGIGATLNIMTGRPLDLGNQTSIGGKIDYDRSNNNIPGELKGKNLTPEVSALISRKFGQDDMFGVSLTASYQKRNSGFASAQAPNGYKGPYAGVADPAGKLSGSTGIENLAPGQLYETPQNLSYVLGGTQRTRTNAQLTFQFRPTKDWTNTLDYTYAQNKQHFLQNSLNVWMNENDKVNGVKFLNGPVQTPASYSENYASAPQDFDMVSEDAGTKSTLKSIGFNSQFRVNSGLKFSLDVHHSTSESGADSPFGTANDLSGVSFGRVANTIDYTKEMPVLNLTYTPQPWQVSGSWFDDAHIKQTVDQVQLGGSLKIGESSNLNFGGGHIKTKFNSEYNHVAANAWTGVVAPSQRLNAGQYFNQANFQPEDYRRYFSKLGGSDDPSLYPYMQVLNFQKVRQDLINFTTANGPNVNHNDQAAPFTASQFSPSLADPQEIRALQEKTNSLYTQFNTEWDTAMPIHTGFGVRYEKTTVDTQYSIRPPVSANWATQNEIEIGLASTAVPQSQSGDYHYWLPTADFDIDVLSNVKLRASWGMTIGRPNWDQIQGGLTVSPPGNVGGLSGSQGNPALKPVKSNNLDLSAEWYYSKHSMVSLGLFNKDLTGYAGTTIQTVPSTTLKTPIGSPAYLAAVQSCGGTSTFCVRNYIFKNYNGQPGVTQSGTGAGADGAYTGQITSDIAGAVPMPLLLSTTVNANKSNIKGAELNWQHMFDNGFGFQANYTYVKSGLHYNNAAPSTINGASQFAMVGLANSANLVGIYENDKTSVRLAYNWRGEFLNSLAAFNQPEPGYTEAYGQVDLSVGYNLTKNLSLSLEGINITNSTQRQHGRTSNEILSAQVTGPRYMVGARYKF